MNSVLINNGKQSYWINIDRHRWLDFNVTDSDSTYKYFFIVYPSQKKISTSSEGLQT